LSTILIISGIEQSDAANNATLRQLGYANIMFANCEVTNASLRSKFSSNPNAILFDICDLDETIAQSCMDRICTELKNTELEIPFLIQARLDQEAFANGLVSQGATDYIIAPTHTMRLETSFKNATEIHRLRSAVIRLFSYYNARSNGLESNNIRAATKSALAIGKQASQQNKPILIEGERGVGKLALAQTMHRMGPSSQLPFVSVHCAGLNSDLNGKLKAYADTETASDFFAQMILKAGKGCIFLDDVSALQSSLQAKLLRALETGKFTPETQPSVDLDCFLAVGTSISLIKAIKNGQFREDLYYRLNAFPIRIAPLRERKEQIPELIETLLTSFSLSDGLRRTDTIDPQTMEMLSDFHWPGNDQQLENMVYRALLNGESTKLEKSDFPLISGELSPNTELKVEPAKPEIADSKDIYGFIQLGKDSNLKSLADIEREAIIFAIDFHRGHMTKVASTLGIGRSTLYRKLQEYGIDLDNG